MSDPGVGLTLQILLNLAILANGILDVGDGILTVSALAATARQVIAPDRDPFFGFNHGNVVSHNTILIHIAVPVNGIVAGAGDRFHNILVGT